MSDYEFVNELVNRTGVSFEEARFAYESCGKDFAAAEEMLFRNTMNNMSYRFNRRRERRANMRNNMRKAMRFSGGILSKMTRNNLSISASREFVTLPILAALIILLITWEIAVPAIIISLFCGVKYTFSGPDIEKDFTAEIKRDTAPKTTPATYTASYSEEPVKYVYPETEEVTDKGFFN